MFTEMFSHVYHHCFSILWNHHSRYYGISVVKVINISYIYGQLNTLMEVYLQHYLATCLGVRTLYLNFIYQMNAFSAAFHHLGDFRHFSDKFYCCFSCDIIYHPMIPMYRLWLHGLYGLYGPHCRLTPEKAIKSNHSLTLIIWHMWLLCMINWRNNLLTHWGLVTHVCVIELFHCCFW